MKGKFKTMDANEAVAYVAYRVNEVIAIYPITPSSNLGEWADEWSSPGNPEHLGHGAPRNRNAERGRRGRRRPRSAANRFACHYLYRFPRAALDDSEHE